MRRILKPLAYLVSLIFVLGPLVGCSLFHSPVRDANGYYVRHFGCCGPVAIRKAIAEYNRRHGIVNFRAITAEEISKKIQDDGVLFKGLLSFFHKEAVCSTWSWEMKTAAKDYGFELISVSDFEKLDPIRDIAFVLVRGRFFSKDWHWMCYPVDENIKAYFGPDTKIDKIYLLQKK